MELLVSVLKSNIGLLKATQEMSDNTSYFHVIGNYLGSDRGIVFPGVLLIITFPKACCYYQERSMHIR